MDLYTRIQDQLSALPVVQEWEQLRRLVERAVAPRPPHWQLPLLASQAVGGNAEAAFPAVVAIACQQIAIMLVDDILDDDPRGEHLRIGPGAAANLACAFQSLGLEMVANCPAPLPVRQAALQSLNRMMLDTTLGQHLDAQTPGDEAAYWKIVQAKSAPFFGAALQAGALLGGASSETAEALYRLGGLYGVLVQIHDDLHDTMVAPAGPDWLEGRTSLPILFAQTVEHAQRERFLALHPQVSDPQKLAEAQTILIRCGAVSYCIDRLLERHAESVRQLAALPLREHEPLTQLFDETIQPVRSLFQALELPDIQV